MERYQFPLQYNWKEAIPRMQILAFYPGFQGQEQKCCLRQSDHMVGEVYLQNMYEVVGESVIFSNMQFSGLPHNSQVRIYDLV